MIQMQAGDLHLPICLSKIFFKALISNFTSFVYLKSNIANINPFLI